MSELEMSDFEFVQGEIARYGGDKRQVLIDTYVLIEWIMNVGRDEEWCRELSDWYMQLCLSIGSYNFKIAKELIYFLYKYYKAEQLPNEMTLSHITFLEKVEKYLNTGIY